MNLNPSLEEANNYEYIELDLGLARANSAVLASNKTIKYVEILVNDSSDDVVRVRIGSSATAIASKEIKLSNMLRPTTHVLFLGHMENANVYITNTAETGRVLRLNVGVLE